MEEKKINIINFMNKRREMINKLCINILYILNNIFTIYIYFKYIHIYSSILYIILKYIYIFI